MHFWGKISQCRWSSCSYSPQEITISNLVVYQQTTIVSRGDCSCETCGENYNDSINLQLFNLRQLTLVSLFRRGKREVHVFVEAKIEWAILVGAWLYITKLYITRCKSLARFRQYLTFYHIFNQFKLHFWSLCCLCR